MANTCLKTVSSDITNKEVPILRIEIACGELKVMLNDFMCQPSEVS